MRNALLFARKEFLERVRTKSFLFTTIFFPIMMLGFTVVPTMMMSRGTGPKQIAVVASSDVLASAINDNLTSNDPSAPDATQFHVETSTDTSDANRTALLNRITDDKHAANRLDGVIWAVGAEPAFYTASAGDFKTQAEVERSVNRAMQASRLKALGVSQSDISALLKRTDLSVHPVSKGQPKEAAGMEAFFTPFSLMFMMYLTMLIYGMAVMRSVLEEKSSKIFEVMLSAATPADLMAGKVLGVGAVGLLQIAIWATAGIVFSGPALGMAGSMLKFSPMQFVFFAVFFLIGYLLYSSLFAAVGAMVNSEQEAQQLQTWVMLPLILCMVFITKIISDPSGPVAFWASMFPFTAPLLMFVRVIVHQPPAWQIGLSVAISITAVFAMLWVCSRIYRVGILMYGKRPTLPEIVKWIKYA
ncbi:MAG: ABC transporter permease [Acidobacteriales bacterium]|nr:ABC transporter permease [Terriglobales bacterium]